MYAGGDAADYSERLMDDMFVEVDEDSSGLLEWEEFHGMIAARSGNSKPGR